MKQRIYIFTQKQVCKLCKDNCAEFDGLTPDCSVCSYKELPHVSAEKASRIMADAMLLRGKQCSFSFQTLADYALRALVEAKK